MLICLFAAGKVCPAANSSKSFSKEDIEKYFAVGIPGDFSKRDAVILLLENKIEIKNKNSAVSTEQVVIKLMKKNSDAKKFLYRGGFCRSIKTIKARTIKADGSTLELNKNKILEISGFDPNSIYSDVKTKTFTLEDARAGDILEVQTVWQVNNILFCNMADFRRSIPILKRRLIVKAPESIKIEYKTTGFDNPPAYSVKKERGKTNYLWEMNNISAFKNEKGVRSLMEYAPMIFLYFRVEHDLGVRLDLSSWDGVARWYRRLTEESKKGKSKVKAIVKNLGLDAMPKDQAVRKAYDYVRSNIRYVSIKLGIGGYKPHDADDVAKYKYGDCKDKATLLNSILEELEIKAFYVLVRSKPMISLPEDEPSIYFNHVISAVEFAGRREYMDPTCSECIYGELPPTDEGAFALLVGSDRGEPVHLPRSDLSTNWMIDSLSLEVDSSGEAGFTFRRSAHGFYRHYDINYFEKHKARGVKALVQDYFFSPGFGVVVDTAYVSMPEESGDSFELKSSGIIKRLSKREMEYIILNPHVLPIMSLVLEHDTSRAYPYFLGVSRIHEQKIHIRYPSSWILAGALDDMSLSIGGFSYECKTEASKGDLMIQSRILNSQTAVPAEEYGDFYEMCGKIAANEKKEIVFESPK